MWRAELASLFPPSKLWAGFISLYLLMSWLHAVWASCRWASWWSSCKNAMEFLPRGKNVAPIALSEPLLISMKIDINKIQSNINDNSIIFISIVSRHWQFSTLSKGNVSISIV